MATIPPKNISNHLQRTARYRWIEMSEDFDVKRAHRKYLRKMEIRKQ